MKVPRTYINEQFKARHTGAHIRHTWKGEIPFHIRKQRQIYRYRRIFQLLILGEKYATISDIVGLKEGSLAMIVMRYAPHLLRGCGNRKEENQKREKTVWQKEEKKEVKEKLWNPKSCKYI